MKNVIIASVVGVAATIALSFLTTWPLALLSGVGAGFFGYRFRQETWPTTQAIAKSFWRNKWDVMSVLGVIISLIAAVLGIGNLCGRLDWSKIGNITTQATAVIHYLLLNLFVIVISCWVLYGFGRFSYLCLAGCASLTGKNKLAAQLSERAGEMYGFNLRQVVGNCAVGLVGPLALAMLLLMTTLRLTMFLYCSERLIIACSVALGGWAFYSQRWASPQPVASMIIGLLVGGLAGAAQYKLLTLPIQRHFAAKAAR